MLNFQNFILLYIIFSLTSCGSIPKLITTAEEESGFTYIPVDPFPVDRVPSDSCKELKEQTNSDSKTTLSSLPDNAVRMLVQSFDKSGNITYGGSKATAKGERYKITIDYINADTINANIWVKKSVLLTDSIAPRILNLTDTTLPKNMVEGSLKYEVYQFTDKELWNMSNTGISGPRYTDIIEKQKYDALEQGFQEVNIPVYVGIGLRVMAEINILQANANVAGIGIIGAEAEAKNLQGSLIVQTLGVNGKSISAALPIQSELNRTTAQNAIVAVGSIKSLLYADDTIIYPRVVGIYLPFSGGKQFVNLIVSELSKKRVEWHTPCIVPTSKPA
ncbi:hypothetical protein [Paraglaciecola hydrolytica]|uniref:Uncharacterized protein n=1 Tax=Paraglaciecola hydrolytica TaxID=1799789 RepID=A0A148KKC8_9ALTE|nr:hypothetical protein [Paraglaciecola hydrolytica]KXI26708.1 hypothetical protein AX660_02730 [Paraglaciecola hydrolytica]